MKPTSDLRQLSDGEFIALARRAVAAADAPAAWRQRALDAFRRAAPLQPTEAGLAALAAQALAAAAQRLVATLSFDSWTATPLATGLRGLRGDTRQLIFNVQGRDIDLRLTNRAGGFSLAGQVLGPDESGLVNLAPAPLEPADAGAAEPRTVPLDAMGEFHLDDVAPGRYLLTLQLGDTEVALPFIDLGTPSA